MFAFNFSNLEKRLSINILPDDVRTIFRFRACLHGGEGPQIGEVTCGGSPRLSCKRDQINMRGYIDRRVTPPNRVTSPSWGSPPPCKQALNGKAPS